MTSTLFITDSSKNYSSIKYVLSALETQLEKLGGRTCAQSSQTRSELLVELDTAQLKFLLPIVEDKVGDVVAVSYKYNFFKKRLRTKGLNQTELELLYCALISADLDEDKRYVKGKFRKSNIYAIDGAYNFLMLPLKNKWAEVVSFIPPVFTTRELREFVKYLANEKRGKKVVVKNDGVYDKNLNKLGFSELIKGGQHGKVVKEVVLSGAGNVLVEGALSEVDKKYIDMFFK